MTGSFRAARLVLTLSAALALADSPAALADSWSDCRGGAFEVRVNACTALINDPQLTQIDRAAAYYNRGAAHLARGTPVTALADFDMAIRLDFSNPAYYYDRGRAYLLARRFDAATADFYKARDLDPKTYSSYAYYMIGRVAEERHDQRWWAAAIGAYTQSIKADPKFTAAYFGRGVAYNASIPPEPDPAIADFSMVIGLDPRSGAAYEKRAGTYYEKAGHDRRYGFTNFASGNSELAIADYDKAIEIGPPTVGLYRGRSAVYESVGRREDAIADLRKALTLGPDESAQRMIKAALERLGATP